MMRGARFERANQKKLGPKPSAITTRPTSLNLTNLVQWLCHIVASKTNLILTTCIVEIAVWQLHEGFVEALCVDVYHLKQMCRIRSCLPAPFFALEHENAELTE